MKRPLLVLGGLLVLAIFTSWLRFRYVPRASGTMPHQAYVWQRDWSPAVRDAVANIDPKLAPPVLLAAEVSWQGATPHVVRVAIDPVGKPFGVALRIGTIDPAKVDTKVIADIARSVIANAPTELHVDFDCAESKLDGYLGWVRAIKDAVKPVPVAITALPAWLDQPAFKRLAAEGPYVLQVHSLSRPKTLEDGWQIFDANAAERYVERAARIGIPFRVALPTYGYVGAFDGDQKLVRVWAENFPAAGAGDYTVRAYRTSPADVAGLIRLWTASRPTAMTGVMWYRLPVPGDVLNWRSVTLAAVMAGRTPTASVSVTATTTQPVDVSVLNAGDADGELPKEIRLSWTGDAPIAADFLAGYIQLDQRPGQITLSHTGPRDGDPASRIAPGDRRAIGWLRFTKDTEVRGHVTSP